MSVMFRITVGDIVTAVFLLFWALCAAWVAIRAWWQSRKRRRGGGR